MTDLSSFDNCKAEFHTLGCKLNFAETSTIARIFAERGIRRAQPGEVPDICVVNTCSVTELADKKCRQTIRRLAYRCMMQAHKMLTPSTRKHGMGGRR